MKNNKKNHQSTDVAKLVIQVEEFEWIEIIHSHRDYVQLLSTYLKMIKENRATSVKNTPKITE